MANSKQTKEYYEYATIDTAPASTGYFTNPVSARFRKTDVLWFSIRETVEGATSSVNITIQYKCPDDAAWQTYYHVNGDDFVIGERYILQDYGPNVVWRAGVVSGDYSSGSVNVGFDW